MREHKLCSSSYTSIHLVHARIFLHHRILEIAAQPMLRIFEDRISQANLRRTQYLSALELASSTRSPSPPAPRPAASTAAHAAHVHAHATAGAVTAAPPATVALTDSLVDMRLDVRESESDGAAAEEAPDSVPAQQVSQHAAQQGHGQEKGTGREKAEETSNSKAKPEPLISWPLEDGETSSAPDGAEPGDSGAAVQPTAVQRQEGAIVSDLIPL